jgi:hypothetical protein
MFSPAGHALLQVGMKSTYTGRWRRSGPVPAPWSRRSVPVVRSVFKKAISASTEEYLIQSPCQTPAARADLSIIEFSTVKRGKGRHDVVGNSRRDREK